MRLAQRGAFARALFLLVLISPWWAGAQAPNSSQPEPGAPVSPGAQKSYASGLQLLKERGGKPYALDAFRKANKQEGGHCAFCLKQAYLVAKDMGEWKEAETIARSWLEAVGDEPERDRVHLYLGAALMQQALENKKEKLFEQSAAEFELAERLYPVARFQRGVSLGRLHRDGEAAAEFTAYLAEKDQNQALRQRAAHYLQNLELTRARMAPAFVASTLDGAEISLDGFTGKVVLLDFWATWCAPCREALPHIQSIVKKFAGEPFVVVSVSMDKDDTAWRSFVEKAHMDWPQCRDGSFQGPIARSFNVKAIPATFTIDADGVLEDQQVGDSNVEGKLKKLIAKAKEAQKRKESPAPSLSERER